MMDKQEDNECHSNSWYSTNPGMDAASQRGGQATQAEERDPRTFLAELGAGSDTLLFSCLSPLKRALLVLLAPLPALTVPVALGRLAEVLRRGVVGLSPLTLELPEERDGRATLAAPPRA